MSRRYHLFLLMGLLILTPALVRAQDDDIPPLTETFTVADYDLDFQHPADWEIMGDDAGPSILFSAPIGGTGEPNTSGIAVEGGATLVQWRFIASDASPAAAAQAAAEDFVGADTDLYNITEPLHLTINGHAAAQVDTTSLIMLQRFISMEIDEETAVVVEMLGLGDSVVRVAPITLAMLATVRESGAPLPDSSPVVTPALMQNHLREADQTSFSAPADWFIEETDNFTLLTAPNGVTVGISSEPLPDLDDIVLDTITLISDNLLRQLPGVELSDIEEFEVNNQRAARVTGMDNGIYFGFWAIGLSSEVVGHISVIGPPEDVSELEAIIFAIAETIISGQVETLTQEISSEDGAFALLYPQGWDAIPNGDTIMLFSGAEDELVILVQNSLAFLSTEAAIELPEDADVATTARAIARAAEENGTQHSIEKLSVNDRAASLLHALDGDQSSFILLFELSDGTFASLLAGTSGGDIEAQRAIMLAIAESVSVP